MIFNSISQLFLLRTAASSPYVFEIVVVISIFETTNSFLTCPVMTNLLRSSRYMSRNGCNTRGSRPYFSASWKTMSYGILSKYLSQSIDTSTKSESSTNADSTDSERTIPTSSARLSGLWSYNTVSIHFSRRCMMSRIRREVQSFYNEIMRPIDLCLSDIQPRVSGTGHVSVSSIRFNTCIHQLLTHLCSSFFCKQFLSFLSSSSSAVHSQERLMCSAKRGLKLLSDGSRV